MRQFYSSLLDDDLQRGWREFNDGVAWSHFMADTRWAEIDRSGSGRTSRRPCFFWAEQDGEIALTALGVRRALPVPGRAFWEFHKSPTFVGLDVLEEWLGWLIPALGHDAVRLRVSPPVPLGGGGDDVESVLERHGFVRRRVMGSWATLCVDLQRSEDEVLGSFRSSTRAIIRKSVRYGVAVTTEDSPQGLAILHDLQNAMRTRTPVPAVSAEALSRISRFWLAGGAGGTVMIARQDDRPLAAILVLKHRDRAFMHMMPSVSHDGVRGGVSTSHLLLWEAIRWARDHDCAVFDLGGYNLMARPGDPLAGVNFFKRGFAPDEEPEKVVATHERVSSSLIEASARAYRQAEKAIAGRRSRGG